MTETLAGTAHSGTMTIRPYRPTDHRACRQLWAELTEEHDARYERAAHTRTDPGAAFEEYLTRLDLGGMWVAEDHRDGVVGFIGLILVGRTGEVDPVVVTAGRRGQGIGRSLLEYVAERARQRGVRQLTVSPAVRNVEAIHCLRAAGYDALARVTLTLDLATPGPWRDGIDLHDVRFRY
jgi:GNAT superfamily N-acetyltransferase